MWYILEKEELFKSAKPTASQGTLKRGCITESVHYLREITEEKPQDDFLSHGHERESDWYHLWQKSKLKDFAQWMWYIETHWMLRKIIFKGLNAIPKLKKII